MNEHAKEIVPSKRHVEFDAAPLSFPLLVLSMNVCLRVWRWNKPAVVREGKGGGKCVDDDRTNRVQDAKS